MSTTNISDPHTPEYHQSQDRARLEYLNATVLPELGELFTRHPWMRSAGMLVAQYWDDEADDAVHCTFVFSQFDRPDLDGYFDSWQNEQDPNFPGGSSEYLWRETWRVRGRWDANGQAISLFAAFCPEGGSQDASDRENCRPYALFRPTADGGVSVQVVGTMLRPWLDGVRPSWDDE